MPITLKTKLLEYQKDGATQTIQMAKGERGAPGAGSKTELLYDGTTIKKPDGTNANFQEIINLLKVEPDFTYLLYGNRAYLPSLIEDDDQGIHYIYFESTMVDSGMSKNAVIIVYSNDGVTISGINKTNVANENYNNKVSAITDRNKSDVNSYTSVKAVVDYVEPLKSDKVDKPADPPTAAGKVLRVKTVNEDGSFVCEWADGGAGVVTDVQVDGVSIKDANGVAEIPKPTATQRGALKIGNYLSVNNDGAVSAAIATNEQIVARNGWRLMTPAQIGLITKSGMTASVSTTDPAWSAEEQQAAQQRIGIKKEWVLKGTMTDPSGLDVDLTGCTELYIRSLVSGTNAANLNAMAGGKANAIAQIATNGNRSTFILCVNTGMDIIPISVRTGSTETNAQGIANCYVIVGANISDITRFYTDAPGNISTCKIDIYAR